MRVEKPLHDLAPKAPPGAPSGPPLIPDFIVDVAGAGIVRRRAVVETMGYRDEAYRARKLRLHPEMRLAAGADAVIEHDFHEPGHWPQEWRDNRLGRELWRVLVRCGRETGRRGRLRRLLIVQGQGSATVRG